MPPTGFIPLVHVRRSLEDSRRDAASFLATMAMRRTTRYFSTDAVPRDLIESAIRTAGTSPSGAHQQPWTFVAIANAELKARMRVAAEREEHAFYNGKAPAEWLEALAQLGTDEQKTHLTDAPWVIVLFRQVHGFTAEGKKKTFYYTQESCGIAAGLFIAAVHSMGLVTLTHTPSPMGFLAELLARPANEKAMLVMPVGYPADDAQVPDIMRKPLDDIVVWKE